MQRKKSTKFILIIMATLFAFLLLTGGSVQAALQSNSSTHYKKTDTLANWVSNIRKMEAAGGAMGLTETLGTNLISTTSNNLDLHCMKSTEYGAIAILSASGYGNPNKIPTSGAGTTTGNNTGILVNSSKWQCVAGVSSALSGVDARYYDLYTTSNTSAKVGDALGSSTTTNPGAAGWHSATYSNWVDASYPYFERGSDGIFSFHNNYVGSGTYFARGVVVCGQGL